MGYEWFLGLRYTRGRQRQNGFISFISFVSVLGVALGVATLIVVLSVMNGFEKILQDRMLGALAHIQVNQSTGHLTHWMALQKHLQQIPSVESAAPYIDGQALVRSTFGTAGVFVRGIEPKLEKRVSNLSQHMQVGTIEDLAKGRWRVIMGRELATRLGVHMGSTLIVVTPQVENILTGALARARIVTVVGFFNVGLYDYDNSLILMRLEDAQALYGYHRAVTGIRIKLFDFLRAHATAGEIAQHISDAYTVVDWTVSHASFFKAIQTEKIVMFIILLLIVTVATFNIVSSLMMMVTEKRADIAILKTLGATPGSILAIFVIQGATIGLLGIFSGTVLGVTVAIHFAAWAQFVEQAFHVQFLASDVYLIHELPSHVQGSDVLYIVGISFLLSIAATLYPSWQAARISPARTLREYA